MKKLLAAFAGLLAAGTVSLALVIPAVCGAQDRVTFTPETLSGDPAAAGDLIVSVPSQYKDQLFWQTDCPVQHPADASTSYRFAPFPEDPVFEEEQGSVELTSSIDFGYVQISGDDLQEDWENEKGGMERAYRELYQETPNGTEGSRVVRLADYYTYYPLQVSITLPGYRFYWDGEVEREFVENSQLIAQNPIPSWFDRMFRIPVLESEQMEIRVAKDVDGNVYSTGTGSVSDAEPGPAFSLYTRSVLTEDACYFVFDAHATDGSLVDVSAIPGGFGIYRLSFRQDADGDSEPVDLSAFYPIDPAAWILDLVPSPDRSHLLLHTVEGNAYVVTVIDCASGQAVQRVEAAELTDEEAALPTFYVDVHEEDGFFVSLVGGNMALVFRQAQDGSCELAASIPLGEEVNLSAYASPNAVMAFDGERLAVADAPVFWDWRSGQADFSLQVFTEQGPVYEGVYRSSLSLGIPACILREDVPLSLRWETGP